MKNQYLILIIFLFSQYCFIISETNEKLEELNDGNFYSKIGETQKSFVIFYLPTCGHCHKAKATLEDVKKEINTNKKYEDSRNIPIYALDCQLHNYACVNFEIKQVPTMILIYEDKYVKFDSYPSNEKLLNFITEIPHEDSLVLLPQELGIFGMVIKVFEEFQEIVTSYMIDWLKSKEINYKWENKDSLLLLGSILVFIICLEIAIISLCCNTSTTKKKKPENKTSNEDQKVAEKQPNAPSENKEKTE